MADDPASESEAPIPGWQRYGGCLIPLAMLIVCAGGIYVVNVSMDVRGEVIPWFARHACRFSGCGWLSMATIGWTVWVPAAGAVIVLALLFRPRQRLFYVLLLPAAGLVVPTLLFAEFFGRLGHEPWIGDLVHGIPNGGALAAGLHCGWIATALVLVTGIWANTAAKDDQPANIRAPRFVRLALLEMLSALLIALLLA